MAAPIDVNFDFCSDAREKDPDLFSRTLRKYQELLWSKNLPTGEELKVSYRAGLYLTPSNETTTFSISSDSISNSWRGVKRLRHILSEIPSASLDEFQRLGSTIGAKIVFPGKKIDGSLTINVARGFSQSIADSFDLTLECIRRQYLREPNPLSKTLATYWQFFELFEDFEGYSEFFLLQDLLEANQVRFLLPFSDFKKSPWPSTVEEYAFYMRNTMDFIRARNVRISNWCEEQKF